MRLIELELENFQTYTGVHTLVLDNRGLVQVSGNNLDDPGNNDNGAGKTTILEALTWCLFGEGLPRSQGNKEKGVQADEVIPDNTKGQTRVTAYLMDEQFAPTHIGVVRWRKYKEGSKKRSSGVTIREDGQDFTYLDMSEGNKHIKKTLGIDRDIWVRSVIFGQESAFNFCEATAKQRADILTTVMGLEELDRWLGRCRDERTNLRPILARAEGAHEQQAHQLEQVRAENPAERVEAWEQQRRQRLEQARAYRDEIEAHGKDQKAKLDALPAPEPIEEPAHGVDPALEERHHQLRTQHIAACGEVTQRERTLAELVGSLDSLRDFNQKATCPVCLQDIQEEHKRSCEQEAAQRCHNAQIELEAAKAAVPVTEQAFAAADAELKEVRQQLARACEYYDVHKARNARLSMDRLTLEQAVKLDRSNWQTANTRVLEIETEVNPHLDLEQLWRAKVSRLEQERAASQAAVDDLQEQMGVLDWWAAEFPRFKTWLFDSVVDSLAAEANRWIKVMTGGVLWIQVSTQRELAKGALKDELDVQLYRWNPDGSITSRPYRVWSGGEKRRVALAVDLGLSRLMAQRASKPYRFLALDEVDRHLDTQGREGLRQVLEELRRERETTLVITHDPEFRASFDREIRVTKHGGASTMETINHGQETRDQADADPEGRQEDEAAHQEASSPPA